jgi:hypothetical protein
MRLRLSHLQLALCLGLSFGLGLAPSSAWAKKVQLEWKEIKGAKRYEIQVLKAGEVVSKKMLDDTRWKGDLGFGVYAYQIRAYDRVGRAGQWSAQKALVVAPQAPDLEAPINNNRVFLYDPQASTTLSWEPVEGASKYSVVIKQGSRTIQKLSVQGTKAVVKALPPGQFTWQVAAMIEATDREPASLQGKTWESSYSDSEEFQIELRQLGKPEPQAPLGVIAPAKDGKVQFEWRKVDGAEAYEVEVRELTATRAPASAGPGEATGKVKTFVTRDRNLTVPVSGEGFGAWKVRALANIDPSNVAGAAGPHSVAEYQVSRNAQFHEGFGYLAVSTLVSPYTLRMVNPGGETRNAESVAGTVRLSGEYYFLPQWAIGGGVEMTRFGLAARHQQFTTVREEFSLNRMTFELMVKYRVAVTKDKYGWFFSPKAGFEYRDFLGVRSTGSTSSTADVVSDLIGTWGPAIGFDLRKQFNERFSLGVKASYFIPIGISDIEGSSFTYDLGLADSDRNSRNFSVGIQGVYWLGGRWGAGVGAFMEMRSLGYERLNLPEEFGSPEGSITQDAFHFFGSLLYTFGK